jgi:hypothetical protein
LQVVAFYDAGIQKLVPRYDKCLNNGEAMLKSSVQYEIKWQYKWFGNKFLFFYMFVANRHATQWALELPW